MLSEFDILNFIQDNLRTPAADRIMLFFTFLGNGGLIWIVLGICLLAGKKHRKTGVLLFVALGIEFLICNVWLKNAVAALRPCDLNPDVQLLIARPLDYSFPSGHTGASFAAVSALCLTRERRWYLALIPAVLIAFSRLYLYVHFPSDIIGGIFVGVGSGILAYVCVRLFSSWYGKRKGMG